MHFSKSFYPSVALGATVHAGLVFRWKQSSVGISILNFPYSRFASNRASEYRNKTCSDSVKRRRLKTRGNSAAGVHIWNLECSGRVLEKILLSTANHHWWQFIPCREFIECLVLFDGLYGHFCLELGAVLFSCLFHGAKLLFLT